MSDAQQQLQDRVIDLCNDLIGLEGLCPVEGHKDELGREKAFAALNAVISFLRDIGTEPAWREPLLQLSAALDDAKYGRANPITKPVPMLPGTPNKLVMDRADEGMAVAAVDILITHCGKKTDEALTAVAKRLGYRKEALRATRKNLRAPKAKGRPDKASKEAVAAYRYWFQELARRGKSPAMFVEAMLETRGFKKE
ncbi:MULTISPECIES: hypothetical protein [unclassified Mesorhizobium]|uniref:hypothetical protein n=1 Tax=unclassified Mesorhizobium TaxID=325217 RepID=UPI000FD767F0|nr:MULTISPECIES: hypothetical protein [unclassified Mesorhizobium]TGR39568.1 hypothetical protein EN842_40765 [bacterium M00.F.Ca.ET.199.01.1.1]TGU29005.1 hypothetical protein EN799_35940 [bacterium M00.F.Ca.ET.156.01.1.1]TGV84292.1 hypothetical protein EN792_021550 [Mesorhizobium sp. M00.F.Ca.ET.149.01.1.1]TGR22395.1 hypothetical protein EN845_22080 [Mesorhizobium sp. M8A.F.Ca.ET.202.01.1.1]TGR23876.1 hypothetical protein EN840_20725 [Mesorhizobium sp. M8A.F.Ca.ET.197.01.1.1]